MVPSIRPEWIQVKDYVTGPHSLTDQWVVYRWFRNSYDNIMQVCRHIPILNYDTHVCQHMPILHHWFAVDHCLSYKYPYNTSIDDMFS